MSKKIEYIDLTTSFTLANHNFLVNEVINVDSDESFISEVNKQNSETKVKNAKINLTIKKKKKSSTLETVTPTLTKFGQCPICWEELGINPLASTKCGHVFCMQCLERSLKVEKRCPNCRSSLRGKTAYHPLYIHNNLCS